MSYNIDTVKVLSMDLKISKENWLKWNASSSEDDFYLPECNFIEELKSDDFDGDGFAKLKRFAWSYSGSGGAYGETLANVIADLIGEAELVFTWEGGDSIHGLRIKDGKAFEHELEYMLIGEGRKL